MKCVIRQTLKFQGVKILAISPFRGLGRVQIPRLEYQPSKGENTLTGTSGPSAEGTSILVAPGAIILGIFALGAPGVNQGLRILWVCVGIFKALPHRAPKAEIVGQRSKGRGQGFSEFPAVISNRGGCTRLAAGM
jgi:hypothetical protein